jgi:hypothetical protein
MYIASKRLCRGTELFQRLAENRDEVDRANVVADGRRDPLLELRKGRNDTFVQKVAGCEAVQSLGVKDDRDQGTFEPLPATPCKVVRQYAPQYAVNDMSK